MIDSSGDPEKLAGVAFGVRKYFGVPLSGVPGIDLGSRELRT